VYLLLQSNTSLSAQQQQLQQLQLLQQQLIRQTQLMQQPTGAPIIDGNLLAQIQALTNQLLSKTDAKTETGERFNKVTWRTAHSFFDMLNSIYTQHPIV